MPSLFGAALAAVTMALSEVAGFLLTCRHGRPPLHTGRLDEPCACSRVPFPLQPLWHSGPSALGRSGTTHRPAGRGRSPCHGERTLPFIATSRCRRSPPPSHRVPLTLKLRSPPTCCRLRCHSVTAGPRSLRRAHCVSHGDRRASSLGSIGCALSERLSFVMERIVQAWEGR